MLYITSLLKCFFAAAAQSGTQSAAVALPVAGPVAMAATITGQEAAVASATQGEVQNYIVIFLVVTL